MTLIRNTGLPPAPVDAIVRWSGDGEKTHMLRMIIKRDVVEHHSGAKFSQYHTIDFQNKEIEARLRSGGYGADVGCDISTVVGVEVVADLVSECDMSN